MLCYGWLAHMWSSRSLCLCLMLRTDNAAAVAQLVALPAVAAASSHCCCCCWLIHWDSDEDDVQFHCRLLGQQLMPHQPVLFSGSTSFSAVFVFFTVPRTKRPWEIIQLQRKKKINKTKWVFYKKWKLYSYRLRSSSKNSYLMTKSNNMTCHYFQCKTKVNFGGVGSEWGVWGRWAKQISCIS